VSAAQSATNVSFTERTWSLNGYALSEEQQREVFAPPRGDEERFGWENLAHCVREPAEQLEFFIRYPFEMNPAESEIRIETSVEEHSGTMLTSPRDVTGPDVLDFSRVRVERMQFMKRLRVVIDRPILGVTYWVSWKLPRAKSVPEKLRYHARSKSQEGDLSKLRSILLGAGAETLKARNLGQTRIRDFVLPVLADHCPSPEALELALFLPVNGRKDDADTGGQALPMLAPIAATFPAGAEEWTKRWSACRGVAGRAFATGRPAYYIGARHQEPPAGIAAGDWQTPNISCYEAYAGKEHSALFGIPVCFDSSQAIQAVLCVGSYRQGETLRLLWDSADGGAAGVARSDLIKRLQEGAAGYLRSSLYNAKV
jgi:hypothetical protein